MTGDKTVRRQPAPLAVWLAVGTLMVAVAALAALVILVWQEATQAERLRAELEKAVSERQALENRLRGMEVTAIELADRLAAVESNSQSVDHAAQIAALQQGLESADRAASLESSEIAELQAGLAAIQSRVDEIQAGLTSSGEGTGISASAAQLPDEAHVAVDRQRQSHNLSCESSAVSMVASYFGLALTEAEALAALPLNANPHLGFRGNVDGPTGGTQDYGVYAGPILDILIDQGLRAWPIDGGLEGIKSAIARGNPVIAWVTYDCQPSTPKVESIGGESVVLVPWQHVVVVTGYDEEGIWANDPWDGKEDFYSSADFERAMGYFGNMAIEVASP